jgi:hypothetical protein
MKRCIYFILLISSLSFIPLHAWKSEETKGDRPIFLGTLTTQEGNTFNVTNITIGRNHTDHAKIILYEKPQNLAPSEKGNIIPVNPLVDLTTAVLELQKISQITVPEPHVIWKWIKDESKRSSKLAYEYIEIMVTWRSGSTVSYLLELGPENTRRPLKIFCDVIDKKMEGVKQEGTILCQQIQKIDLRKKGAPFPSIQSLKLDEPCYRIPKENGDGMKAVE